MFTGDHAALEVAGDEGIGNCVEIKIDPLPIVE